MTTPSSSPQKTLLHSLLGALGRILGVIAIILLTLPVAILPLFTATPMWAWLVLALSSVSLLIYTARMRNVKRRLGYSLAGMAAIAVLAVLASQIFAATPPILGEDGRPLPGSIAVLEQVELNGSKQWITIRGEDATKPVLLNLGMGGPGGGGFATRTLFEPLEKDFVVVSWDEPGTGKSINAVPFSRLNRERFVEDAHALTQYLQQRFDQQKIYVYGVSWTSILGVWLVQEYPEDYYAYIGNGQMVNTTENDVMGYEMVLEHLQEKGDAATLGELQRNGPPPYRGDDMLDRYVAYMDVQNEMMDTLPYSVVVPLVPFFAPEYGLVDKVNHTIGLMRSFETVYPQLEDLDFTTQATHFEIPVYIFAGRNDINAMYTLVEEYYNLLEAPHKQLIWLEGGHGLDGENLPQFVEVMVNHVLKDTWPGNP